jgi:hypothetical protein
MAVATVASATTGTIYTTTQALNPGAGAFVLGTTWDADGTDNATATYGGNAMTKSGSLLSNGECVPLFTIGGQSSGSKDMVVSTGTNYHASVASFSGVDATTPIRGSVVTANNAGGVTNTLVLSVPSDAADLVVVAYVWRLAAGSVSLSTGSKLVTTSENSTEMGFITVPGASTVNLTITGIYNTAVAVAVSLKDAGTGGGGGTVSETLFHRRAALSVLHV